MATLIARSVEAIILVGAIYIKKDVLAIKMNDMISIPKSLIRMVWKPICLVTLSEILWALGAVLYTAAYGIVGSQALAAAALVGNKIGENKIDMAKEYASRIIKICIIIGIGITLSLLLAADPIVNMFAVSDAVKEASKKILYIIGVCIIFRVYNSLMTIGILRGGGDTLVSFLIEIGTMWFIGVPLSFMAAIWWKWPIEWIVACILGEWVTKFILCQIRFRSGHIEV